MPVVNGVWELPAGSYPKGQFMPAPIKLAGGKDGWSAAAITKVVNSPIHNLSTARGIGMDIEQLAVEVNGTAVTALEALKTALDKFKSTLTNDLTSIKAAGTRIQSEVLQMKQAYSAAQAILTTPEFERAVLNAERMATALKAISEVSATKVNVTISEPTGT